MKKDQCQSASMSLDVDLWQQREGEQARPRKRSTSKIARSLLSPSLVFTLSDIWC